MRTLRERFGLGRWEQSPDDAPPMSSPSHWNTLSTLGAGSVADVDPTGTIFMRGRPVSVEVWFGTGDRWARGLPSDGVRQSRVVGLPIVETRQRVGDGDVVQTAWADESGDGRGRVVLRLENETEVAVVAAIVVRPHALLGRGWIVQARVSDTRLVIDKLPLVELGREPGDVAVALDDDRDTPALVAQLSLASDRLVGGSELVDKEGRASIAALVPLTPGVERKVEIFDGHEASTVAPAPLDNIVAGWRAHLEQAASFELPGWPKHVPASLMSSLLGAAADEDPPIGDHGWTSADDAVLIAALGGVGLDWAAATIADRLLESLIDGWVPREDWVRVAAACAWIAGTERGAEVLAKHADAVLAVGGHALSNARAIALVQPLLRVIESAHGTQAASDAGAITGRLALLADGVEYARLGWPTPAEAASEIDDVLDRAISPLDAETIGLAMVASAQIERPFEPLVPLRALAGSSWRWPRNTTCGDSPHARAALLVGLRSLCVSEYPGGPAELQVTLDTPADIDVLPGFSKAWLGQNLSFKKLPTSAGPLSVALRWHGERAALLWEFEGESTRQFSMTCTTIDPTFATDERSGEALLEAPTHLVEPERKSLL